MPKRFQSLKAIRLATYLLPPFGLILLWRSSLVGYWRKIFGTVLCLLLTLLYLSGVPGFLYYAAGIDVLEWRGGYVPALTFSKTLPDYKKLEASRAGQTNRLVKAPETNAVAKVENYWTSFRGPKRDGHYEKRISTNWPKEGLPLVWRQPIGGGYASFVVAEGRVYTLEQRREYEVATAYAVSDGRELWTNGWSDKFEEPLGGEGPRATPAYDQGRIYVLGGQGELRCLDAGSGRLIWRHNILLENNAEVLTYGLAASPLVVDNKVIVLPGGSHGNSVVAYDKLSGAVIWKSLSDKQSYTSPMLVTLAGREQILIVSAQNVMGISPQNGRLLWHLPWLVQNENAIAQPVLLGTNRFLLSAGYGKGCRAFEVDQTNGEFSARGIWRNTLLKNKFSSSVFDSGCVYGLDEDILVCLDAQTGERKWKDGRYGYGQLLLVQGCLLILGGDGDLALVKASPLGYEELARFSALHGKTWNHPAIGEGKIFIRNSMEMACYDLAAGR